MRVGVLGPLRVEVDGRPVELSARVQRRLLAALVVHVGQVVSVNALIDAVWGDTPPASAVKTVHSYVARLRDALAADRATRRERRSEAIVTAAPGYRLDAPGEAVDAVVFTDRVRTAQRAVDRGEPDEAERLLVEAFELWRGEPYGEFIDGALFAAEAQRLTEVRLAGLDARLEVGLALGRDTEVVADARALCAEHPLHEQFWVHLVKALYRGGRQADALAALRRVRLLLAEEIGADPGVELSALEQRVLRQDPTLAAPRHPVVSAPLPVELDPAGRPLYGRAEELAWLHEAWTDVAERGEGRLLVIAGPPGSGRTRLVAEFASELHARGVAVYYGRLAPGLAVLDDLDEDSAWPLAGGMPDGCRLCVATYDPTTASPGLRRALLSTAHEERLLAPLDQADIAQIVVRVAGTADPEVIQEVAAAANGWPGQAEQLTARLVEERTSRRVIAAADQARPASRALASARAEVASGVRDLTRMRVRYADPAAGHDSVACPYKGLAFYDKDDAVLFHGREELIAKLCARLIDTKFVAVVGPSGAGKSSLVRAGLLPALAAGVLPGLGDAEQHLLSGVETLPSLSGPAVIVVDQFEEIFSAAIDEADRERYLDGLTGLASQRMTRVVVVLRGDFVGACATHDRLAELVGDGTVLVGPMRPDEIRRAVELPAQQVGLRCDPLLLDAIVTDMRDAPAALPLMSTALVEVWQARYGDTLTAVAYHRAGGVPGALARLAEAAFSRLDPPAQTAGRKILLRLADTGEAGVLVRRRVPRRELGDDPATERALRGLVNRRLLTSGDSGIEVTHEALLTNWPRLAGWLTDDEQGRALRRHLAPAAIDWDGAGRPDAELYRGARLASALDWAGDRLADLTDVESDFLTASRDYADRQLAEETARADRAARARRRLRTALAATLALLLIAGGATWLAINRQHAAQAASRQNLLTALSAEADRFAVTDPSLAAQLDLVAYRMAPTPQRATTLIGTQNATLSNVLNGGTNRVLSVAFDPVPGSHLLASGPGNNGKIRLWNLTNQARPELVGQAATTTSGDRPVIFSPDGHILASSSDDGMIRLWDVLDPTHPALFGTSSAGDSDAVALAFSADGHTLASSGFDDVVQLWDIADPAHPRKLGHPLTGHGGPVTALAFSRDGRTLASGSWDTTLRLWNVTDPAHVQLLATRVTFNESVRSLAFSPDGKILGSGGSQGTVRLWNVADPAKAAEVGPLLVGHSLIVNSLAFSPDGHILASGDWDTTIRLWDVANPATATLLQQPLTGHTGQVRGVAFSTDGNTLASGSTDGTIRLWDVPSTVLLGHYQRVVSVAFTADGQAVASSGGDGGDGTVRLWNLTGRALAVLDIAMTDFSDVIAVSPDGRTLADAGVHSIRLWDITDASHPTLLGMAPIDPSLAIIALAFSPDGRTLAGAGIAPVQLWDVTDPAKPARVGKAFGTDEKGLFWSVAFSRDGHTLASSTTEGTIRLWNVTDPAQTTELQQPLTGHIGNVYALAYSLDGHTLVSGADDGTIRLWNVANPAHSTHLSTITGHLSGINSVALSPDGHTLASGDDDGTVRLWNVTDPAHPRALGVLTGHIGTVLSVAFSPDGKTIASADANGVIRLWDLNVDDAIRRICATTQNVFGRPQWDEYVSAQLQYDPPCQRSTPPNH